MNTLELNQHDPVDRQLDGEPRFALMGRDPLGPPMVRLYAAIVEGRYDRAEGLLTRLLDVAKSRKQRPHKDPQHAWSARRVADEMEQWAMLNIAGEQPKSRINTLPQHDGFETAPTHGELKRARPPAEPEEAS